VSLLDLQHGLAWTLLRAASPADADGVLDQQLDQLALSPAQRRWLAGLPQAHGFQITCFIQRWWRETKLRSTLRLTLRALGAGSDGMIREYLDRRACGSLFYLPEALSFLDFVSGQPALPAHVGTVAAFERAYLFCQEARSNPAASRAQSSGRRPRSKHTPRLRQHPAATLIGFAAPPVPLMARLLDGDPLPPESSERWWVLVAPGLEQLWSPITDTERDLFARFQAPHPMPAPALRRERSITRRLLAAGALETAT
jgi:hypothetical protein